MKVSNYMILGANFSLLLNIVCISVKGQKATMYYRVHVYKHTHTCKHTHSHTHHIHFKIPQEKEI